MHHLSLVASFGFTFSAPFEHLAYNYKLSKIFHIVTDNYSAAYCMVSLRHLWSIDPEPVNSIVLENFKLTES